MARCIASIVALALLPLVAVAAIVPVDMNGAEVILGNGATAGTAEGTGTAAQFNLPYDCSFDSSGNLYIMDYSACRIRKVPPGPPYTTSTFVGPTTGVCPTSGSFSAGPGTSTFVKGVVSGVWLPNGLAMFVSSYINHQVYKVTSSGAITVHAGSGTSGSADGSGIAAQLNLPTCIDVDIAPSPPVLFLSENHRIRRITSDSAATVTVLAGGTSGYLDAAGTAARFSSPRGIAVWQYGNRDIFVAELSSYRIRRVVQSSRAVTTFAGSGSSTPITDGIGTAATFGNLFGIEIDPTQTYLFVVSARQVRRIELATATVVTVVNAAGTAAAAGWSTHAQSTLATVGSVNALCISPSTNNLFVVGSHSILEVGVTVTTTTTTTPPTTITTTTTTAAPSTTTTTTTAPPTTTTTTTAAPSTTTTTATPAATTTTTATPATTTTTTAAPTTSTTTTTTTAPSTTTTTTAAASPITTASVLLNEATLGNVSIPANFTLPLTLPPTFSPLSISRAAGHSGYGWATTIAVLSITVASMAF